MTIHICMCGMCGFAWADDKPNSICPQCHGLKDEAIIDAITKTRVTMLNVNDAEIEELKKNIETKEQQLYHLKEEQRLLAEFPPICPRCGLPLTYKEEYTLGDIEKFWVCGPKCQRVVPHAEIIDICNVLYYHRDIQYCSQCGSRIEVVAHPIHTVKVVEHATKRTKVERPKKDFTRNQRIFIVIILYLVFTLYLALLYSFGNLV